MRENVSRNIKEGDKEIKEKKPAYIPNRVSFGRLIAIMKEFRAGFTILQKYDLAVTFFGSARHNLDPKLYAQAEELAAMFSRNKFTILTGGANGIMKAANKGAFEAGGDSVGLNIMLPDEQRMNMYTTESQEFKYFYVRKVMLAFASEIYVFFPGGFGTLDEFFEIITLIQSGKIQRIPVVLFGRDYWTPLVSWIEESLYKKNGTINKEDLEIFTIVDSVPEAYETAHKLLKKLCPNCVVPNP